MKVARLGRRVLSPVVVKIYFSFLLFGFVFLETAFETVIEAFFVSDGRGLRGGRD